MYRVRLYLSPQTLRLRDPAFHWWVHVHCRHNGKVYLNEEQVELIAASGSGYYDCVVDPNTATITLLGLAEPIGALMTVRP